MSTVTISLITFFGGAVIGLMSNFFQGGYAAWLEKEKRDYNELEQKYTRADMLRQRYLRERDGWQDRYQHCARARGAAEKGIQDLANHKTASHYLVWDVMAKQYYIVANRLMN